MIRRSAALLLGISVGTVAAQTASAATLELTRNSRPVTSEEAAGGAPLGGVVHDFFVTSDADLLSLLANINVSVYQHPYGDDHTPPHPTLVAMFPALGANSYFKLPSNTVVFGGGFNGTGPEKVWGDLNNDGPQSNYLFGRLTSNQVGTFSGHFSLRNETSYVDLPFSIDLPGAGEGLMGSPSEQLSVVAAAPPYPTTPDEVVTTSPDSPAIPIPSVPTPTFDPFAYSEKSFAGTPVSVALTRRTRPVTSEEVAAGAPDGYVHEFFVTSSTDVIDIRGVALDVPIYQHEYGLDNRFPSATHLLMFPGITADSFVDTPGKTSREGGFAAAFEDSNAIWYDRFNNGPQDEFLFARLTVDETGSFSGDVSVAGPNGRVELPFDFVLPGTAEDLALIDHEPQFSLAYPPGSVEDFLVLQR